MDKLTGFVKTLLFQ